MERMLAVQILTSPIAMLLLGYALAMVVLALLIQPTRLKLIASIDAMLVEERWSDEQRGSLYALRDHSMSFLIGLLVPVAVVSVILDDILGRDSDLSHGDELSRDPRYIGCVWRFFLSLAAANPLAALASISLMLVSFVIGLAFKRKPARALADEAVEEPTLRALGRFQPAF